MMRRLPNAGLGRRAWMAPGPGAGVLTKKLRSRWFVRDPTYWKSTAVFRKSSRWTSKLHWFFRAGGRWRFGETTSGGAPGPTAPVGLLNDSVGLAGSEKKVNSAASGGLFVRNVNVFIWFGL